MKPKEYIQEALQRALKASGLEPGETPWLGIERPKQEGQGDLSTTLAMTLAKKVGLAPREAAAQLIRFMPQDPAYLEKVEIAGPGFINFYFAKPALQHAVLEILREGASFGRSAMGGGRKVQLEFVSANPTGPLVVVSARAAAVGDVLRRCYRAAGFDARSEYYINDAGRQIRLLGASLSSLYMNELGHAEPFPEEGYHGNYLRDLARQIVAREGDRYATLPQEDRAAALGRIGMEEMIARHRASLATYGVEYDHWFRESGLRQANAQQVVLDAFAAAGLSYEQEGALWFCSTRFGDEKDRVLVTSDGEPTYFLIDIAYHEDKFRRGFEKVIDFWGPDHHGYIPRMRAALQALGHPAGSFEVSIIQQINLLRGGQIYKMSKRAGQIIEMDELIEEVGSDAARFYFIDRRISQPMDFDIDLAKTQSDENPVYYVQMAHARICNIERFAIEQGLQIPAEADTSPLGNTLELQVIKKLLEFPEVIQRVVQHTEPHRVTNYVQELAAVFHRFYHENRVVTEDTALSAARLMLARATRQVLANAFDLLGISAPENMR
ncbi:MAG TPA: arginine--tRNA ligase [bacterium]|nr:arginine--tRNA ligase [bacterium]